ncbi:MAG: hypothetical protein ACYC61_32825 [Isosphaeraceae bacterium]
MRPTSRIPVWASILASAMVAALLVVAGCTLDKPENLPGRVFNRIGGHGGQIIEPKRCMLRVVILDRPFRDPAINEALWRVADEQVITRAEQKALQANGLRVGRIIGDVPREIETILRSDGHDGPRVVPAELMVESGDPKSLISVSPRVEQVSLLINRDDRVSGRDYRDVSGYLRMIPRHHGAHAVSLRVIPELHHGPIQRTFPTLPNATGIAPQELQIRDAQQEEEIRELAFDLVLEDNHVAVIGCRPDNLRSLGSFLFSQPAAENDERHQRVILVWATRNMPGVVAEVSRPDDKPDERPRMFRRMKGATEPPPSPDKPDMTPPSIPATPAPTPVSPRPAATPGSGSATAPVSAPAKGASSPRAGNSQAPTPTPAQSPPPQPRDQ